MAKLTQVDQYIESQADWQQANLNMFRELLHEVAADVEEGWKWDVPVFLINNKLITAMSVFKEHTKFNFFSGAKLDDQHKLFNSGLDSKQHRSINLREGEIINQNNLRELILEAIERQK